MTRPAKRLLAGVSSLAVIFTSLAGSTTVSLASTITDATDGLTYLSQDEIDELNSSTSSTRTSVHDPSVVSAGDGSYYIFGSHNGVSSTTDLQNWTSIYSESLDNTLFGKLNDDGEVEVCSYAEVYDSSIDDWNGDSTIAGNQWAPDVIYNETMGKWCMYMSINGDDWHSSIVLLTADDIEGPYVYQGAVVYSGFVADETSANYYKNCDLEEVYGELDELPEKYDKIGTSSTWGDYWPNAIDPCVYTDDEGNIYMSYGSWSGGVFVLEIDETTGLRDYSVSYDSDYDTLGKSGVTDAYFGKKIAGGYYVSGEGSYIQKIGDYYYLFMSYGFYSPEGGYNMRVFRSTSPYGEFTDENGNSALYTSYVQNYSSTVSTNNRGMKIMGNYKWDTMSVAEVAQGHNSVLYDDVDGDGENEIFVVYHTKFADGSVSHEIRVHQLFMNEKGWLVAAPYEYSGEELSASGYDASEIAGTYGLITHDFQIDYASLEYKSPETITLNSDGTITGAYTGTWAETDGSAYATIVIDDSTYYGVFTKQIIDGSNIESMCFTAMNDDGLAIWGSGEPGDDAVVAQNVANSTVSVPKKTLTDLTLDTEGMNGATLVWESSDEDVISSTGELGEVSEDTTVTLTEAIIKGDYYTTVSYEVTVVATPQNDTDSVVVGEYFTDEAVDLSNYLDGSLYVSNPVYSGTYQGLDLSGGVTIEFDAEATGDVHVLGTIFSFMGNGGRLYFTPGSYLGYNATGGYYDANLNSYSLVEDYIGDEAHVAIELTQTGFTVTVNDEVAYTEEILSTDNGAGTVTDYTNVLDWLQDSADTLYFGYGSWWNSEGYDEANILLSNVVVTVGPITEAATVTYDEVSYENDGYTLETAADITELDNPFYGKKINNLNIEYSIVMDDEAAANGWDGILAFYNTSSTGRVSLSTNPYICYNDGNGTWMDINQPGAGGTDSAADMADGESHDVAIAITTSGVTITVDDEDSTVVKNSSGSAATYTALLNYVTSCDELTLGVGQATSSYWYTELCTVSDLKIYSVASEATEDEESEAEEEETVDPADYVDSNISFDDDGNITGDFTITNAVGIVEYENPLQGKDIETLHMEYSITFDENAAANGWDGIFSFYDTTGTGRVSLQTAPYICYNDMAGNWIDFNQPGAGGDDTAAAGETKEVAIDISEDEIVITVDGEEITTAENGSGATYADMLDYIASVDGFSVGVGQATTSFWNTELCSVNNLSISYTTPHAHSLVLVEAVEPSCEEEGNSQYFICSDASCGKMFSDEAGENEISAEDVIIAATGHTEVTSTKAATIYSEGEITTYCSVCGKVLSTETIPRLTVTEAVNNVVSTVTSVIKKLIGLLFGKH